MWTTSRPESFLCNQVLFKYAEQIKDLFSFKRSLQRKPLLDTNTNRKLKDLKLKRERNRKPER